MSDLINHPPHYTAHPSGVECIQITEHMGFNLGNAVKYIWRADEKGNALEDLQKARWYIEREIDRRTDAMTLKHPLDAQCESVSPARGLRCERVPNHLGPHEYDHPGDPVVWR